MQSSRVFRSLSDLALVAALLPLGGCIVNVLPELESESATTVGSDDATTDELTTGASPRRWRRAG